MQLAAADMAGRKSLLLFCACAGATARDGESEAVEVRVDGDAVEMVCFPGPDRSVTLEGLRTFRVTNRHYRNRRIGRGARR